MACMQPFSPHYNINIILYSAELSGPTLIPKCIILSSKIPMNQVNEQGIVAFKTFKAKCNDWSQNILRSAFCYTF